MDWKKKMSDIGDTMPIEELHSISPQFHPCEKREAFHQKLIGWPSRLQGVTSKLALQQMLSDFDINGNSMNEMVTFIET